MDNRIPLYPDVSAPEGVTPEKFAEWLRRLRTSTGFEGRSISPAGTAYGPSQQPVVDPAVVQKFLQVAQTQGSPLTGSYSRAVGEKLGLSPEAIAESGATPATLSEFNTLYPPTTYDLPQDQAAREAFARMDAATSKQYADEKKAEAEMETAKSWRARAEAEKTSAEAELYKARYLPIPPETSAVDQAANAELRQTGGGVAPATVATPAPTPNFARMAEGQALGGVAQPVKPLHEIASNERPKAPGDYCRTSGGGIIVWNGSDWQRWQGAP
jgi:hypothetical protein